MADAKNIPERIIPLIPNLLSIIAIEKQNMN